MRFKVIGEIKYKDGTIEEVLEEIKKETPEELQKFKLVEVKEESDD